MGELDDPHDDIGHIRKRIHDLADFMQVQATAVAVMNEKWNTVMVRIDSNVEQRNRIETMVTEVRQYMRSLDQRQDQHARDVGALQIDMRAATMTIDTIQHEIEQLQAGQAAINKEMRRIVGGTPNVSTYSKRKKAALWSVGITFLLGAIEFMHEAVELMKAGLSKFGVK